MPDTKWQLLEKCNHVLIPELREQDVARTGRFLNMFGSTRVQLAARVRSFRPAGRRMSTQAPAPKTDVLGIVFFSGICVFSAGLGVWQVQR